jgi:hypothetical protein
MVIFNFLRSFFFSKKGFVYSLISIFLLVIIFFIAQNYVLNLERPHSEFSGHAVFSQQLENFILPRLTTLVVFEGTQQMIAYTFETNTPLTNIESDFANLLFNGTSPSGQSNYFSGTFQNLTLEYATLVNQTTPYNLEITPISYLFALNQSNPWFIDVQVAYVYSVFLGSTPLWENKTSIVTVQVPIEGFIDPQYGFNGFTRNVTIRKAPYAFGSAIFGSSDIEVSNNIVNLTYHIGNESYAQYNGAPSFLSRFLNYSGAEADIGIENIVNPVLENIASSEVIDRPFVPYLLYIDSYDCETDSSDSALYVFDSFVSNAAQGYGPLRLNRARIVHYTGLDFSRDASKVTLACPLSTP